MDMKKKALPPFDPALKPETRPDPAAETDPVAKLYAQNWHSPNSHGFRQAFSFEREGVPMRSLAYVFHRHLFGLKVRITVPAKAMDQQAFEKMADAATRWLVPQIDVQNFGTCGTVEVHHEPPGVSFEDWAKAEIIRGFTRVQWENCGTTEENKLPELKGRQKVEIVYPAGTWEGSSRPAGHWLGDRDIIAPGRQGPPRRGALQARPCKAGPGSGSALGLTYNCAR
jgi:hypothetical protein